MSHFSPQLREMFPDEEPKQAKITAMFSNARKRAASSDEKTGNKKIKNTGNAENSAEDEREREKENKETAGSASAAGGSENDYFDSFTMDTDVLNIPEEKMMVSLPKGHTQILNPRRWWMINEKWKGYTPTEAEKAIFELNAHFGPIFPVHPKVISFLDEMQKNIPSNAMNPDEQRKNRLLGIGSTDVRAATDSDEVREKFIFEKMYNPKGAMLEGNPHIQRGYFCEPEAAMLASVQLGPIYRLFGSMRSPKYPYLTCTPDGLTANAEGVEIKAKLKLTDYITPEHMHQIQQCMVVMDLKKYFYVQVKTEDYFKGQSELYIMFFDRDDSWFTKRRKNIEKTAKLYFTKLKESEDFIKSTWPDEERQKEVFELIDTILASCTAE